MEILLSLCILPSCFPRLVGGHSNRTFDGKLTCFVVCFVPLISTQIITFRTTAGDKTGRKNNLEMSSEFGTIIEA